jgi:caffeoyl-CoA O-methyltransferase
MADLVDVSAARYAEEYTSSFDGVLRTVAAWTQRETETPGMMTGGPEARLLQLLIRLGGARVVLEVGTFTGFGALAMAAALPPGGSVITLEIDEHNAEVARRHIVESPYADRIRLVVGDALQTIPRLEGPFDLVYIDAWKASYPDYYEAVMPKLSERGVIVADNLFRNGLVLDPAADDELTHGMREFTQRVHEDERVDNVLLTVGDGLMVAWRRGGRDR